MTTFKIDAENNITAFTSSEQIAGSEGETETFRSRQELAALAEKWPATRLVGTAYPEYSQSSGSQAGRWPLPGSGRRSRVLNPATVHRRRALRRKSRPPARRRHRRRATEPWVTRRRPGLLHCWSDRKARH